MAIGKPKFYWDAAPLIAWITDEKRSDPTEMAVVRYAVGLGLLLAAWRGQQWAVALVALGSLVGALASFVFGLTSGNFMGLAIGRSVANDHFFIVTAVIVLNS